MKIESSVVEVESADGIAVVTLNRPEHLNALSAELRKTFCQVFASLGNDPEVQVIVLTGAGRAFTAGLDLKELGGEKPVSEGVPDETFSVTTEAAIAEKDLAAAMLAVPQPIIGAINGFAITGGFEIALLCDFLIAGTGARFADTHARVGVVPGWGLSQRLPRLIGINRAKELSLTGNFLSAQQACDWGLVNRVVPDTELLDTCRSLARDIISTDPVTRGEILRIMDEGWHTTLREGLIIEQEANLAHAKAEVRADKVAERRAAIQARGREFE